MTEPFFVTLPNRGQIQISGADALSFLQNLITNDVKLLNAQDCVYACLLSPQGKFLYDFFMTQNGNGVSIDCEGGERCLALEKTFKMYALRADITFQTNPEHPVYAIIGKDTYGHKDPRNDHMGFRSFQKPTDIEQRPFDAWDKHRIALCIPDGSRDMIVQKSTLLECNIDRLKGISLDKGCYVGQEITARMHYRGLVKKRLKAITAKMIGAESFPDFGDSIRINDKSIGEMRSSQDDIGLALIKNDAGLDEFSLFN